MNKAIASTILIAASASMCWAADTTSDTETTLSAHLNTGTATLGEQLYEEHCAQCHQGGVAKAPHKMFLEMMAPDAIVAALSDGIMQQQASALDADQHMTVAEYLAGPLGAEPQPAAPACDDDDWFDPGQPPQSHPWGQGLDNRRYVSGKQAEIPATKVHQLEVEWALAFPKAQRARSHPVLAAGAVFVGSQDGTVYALDQASGCIHWTFRASAEVRTAIGVTPWSGDELDDSPTVYFGDLMARVHGLDARTGALRWMVRVDPHPNATITGTPVYFDDRIFVPISSLEVTSAADPNYPCCSFRGSVAALDASNGEMIWKTYTVDEEPAPTAKNAIGVMQMGPSGAPIWNSPTIDRDRGLLFVGSGENYSSPAEGNSDALIALELATGKKKWVYQATENDAWNVACMLEDKTNCPIENGPDVDFGAGTMLVETPKGRSLLLGGQKSGEVHAVDPDTGELVWKTRVGRGGIQGGIHFGMAADDQRLYVPISDFDDGQEHPYPDRPGLFALDLDSGEELWAAPAPDVCDGREFCSPGISAAITATDGGIIAGHMDGWIRIYDPADGDIIWAMDTTKPLATVNGQTANGGSIGGPGAALGNGRVFINSGYGIYFHMPGNVLLSLKSAATNSSSIAPES